MREFYDPDTVQLMNWISEKTEMNSSFAGSMQLLAGVKCCTARRLTNHPHFEDETLRSVTKELYQIYALQPAKLVYNILRKYKADYMIIENSICYTGPKLNFCSTKELLDIDNKHLILPNDKQTKASLTKSQRFCDQIQYNMPEYTRYFKLVMKNPTFRVYKLI